MNEKILKGQEMVRCENGIETVISTIMEKALTTRPKEKVYYRPFKNNKYVRYTRTLSGQKVYLEEMYPDAQVGDGVRTDFNIIGHKDEEIYLNVSPHVKVWYNKILIYDGIEYTINTSEKLNKNVGGEHLVHLPIRFQKYAQNTVSILCVKEEERDFSFEFLISVKRYPFMWANDYLFWARAVLPEGEMAGEEGVSISKLIKAEELSELSSVTKEVVYQWPPKLPKKEKFDFEMLCGEGDISYVYTEAVCNHVLSYHGNVERIYVNGKENEIYAAVKSKQNQTQTGSIAVKAGDRILFRCCRGRDSWMLALDTHNLKLSFLNSDRAKGNKAMYVGPFWGKQCHGPEYDWDLSKVFRNQKGEQLYWGFCDGSELRIYLDSIFYGQWFYALMVGFYGIREASIYLEDTKKQRLFCENMSMLAKYFNYIEYDIKKHTMPAFMPRLYELNVLDNIGTMGMNLIDAYLDSNDKSLLPIIERIRYQAEETIPRFEDGTYYRLDTMWADDLYMSCPFLIRMGRLTGDAVWFEKAKAQIKGFRKRLYIEEECLFSHIYFPQEGVANKVPWGRGNGWVMWTLSELLMLGEGKVDLSEEKELFYNMAHSIRRMQDESGLWHQVLNRVDDGSYLETSCTGMFLLAFTRGVKYGWLEEGFHDCMRKAWNGLLTHSIDREGNVYGVCMGSGCHMEAEYYFSIPTIINDDHGTGVILAAGSEYGALMEENNESN